MGTTWVLPAPDGTHVGPMNLAIRDSQHDYQGIELLSLPQVIRHKRYRQDKEYSTKSRLVAKSMDSDYESWGSDVIYRCSSGTPVSHTACQCIAKLYGTHGVSAWYHFYTWLSHRWQVAPSFVMEISPLYSWPAIVSLHAFTPVDTYGQRLTPEVPRCFDVIWMTSPIRKSTVCRHSDDGIWASYICGTGIQKGYH